MGAPPRERIGELPGGPLRVRVLGHIEVNDPTAGVSENDKDEEDLEGDRGHDEEVGRHEVLHVVLEEGEPGRGGWLPGPHHVLLHRRLTHGNAELRELAQMRGEPRGFAADILRMRSRTSGATGGLPTLGREK